MDTNKKKAFTLIELLVVIAIIALLLSVLVPALRKVKGQAQAAICRSNVKQWGMIFMMYAQDNDNSFPQNYRGDGLSHYDAYWCHATLKYYDDPKIRFCPACKRNMDRVREIAAGGAFYMNYGKTFMNWGPFADPATVTSNDWWDEYPEGSYGMNEWCSNPPSNVQDPSGLWGAPPSLTWRKLDNVKSSSIVPLFLDCKLVDTYPLDTSPPPAFPDADCFGEQFLTYPMKMICMDRHKGAINAVFVDLSASKVGLKDLWKQKWHKNYNTSGPWTQPNASWPEWMANF